jgi:hypothetical protein
MAPALWATDLESAGELTSCSKRQTCDSCAVLDAAALRGGGAAQQNAVRGEAVRVEAAQETVGRGVVGREGVGRGGSGAYEHGQWAVLERFAVQGRLVVRGRPGRTRGGTGYWKRKPGRALPGQAGAESGPVAAHTFELPAQTTAQSRACCPASAGGDRVRGTAWRWRALWGQRILAK